jgi:hypothetical protein
LCFNAPEEHDARAPQAPCMKPRPHRSNRRGCPGATARGQRRRPRRRSGPSRAPGRGDACRSRASDQDPPARSPHTNSSGEKPLLAGHGCDLDGRGALLARRRGLT